MRKVKQCNPGHREFCKGPSAVCARSHFMFWHQTHELQTPSRGVCSCCGRQPGARLCEEPPVEEAGEPREGGGGGMGPPRGSPGWASTSVRAKDLGSIEQFLLLLPQETVPQKW